MTVVGPRTQNMRFAVLLSKGSAAKPRLLRPRFWFARDSAHPKLTRFLRAPQPNPGCYALAFGSRATALTQSSPVFYGLRSQTQAAMPSLLVRARQRSPKAHPFSKGSATLNFVLRLLDPELFLGGSAQPFRRPRRHPHHFHFNVSHACHLVDPVFDLVSNHYVRRTAG